MTFHFDTSGGILCATFRADQPWTVYWSDLSPFDQSYVGAMFAAQERPGWFMLANGSGEVSRGFSDIAPETLARIMEDCERWDRLYPMSCNGDKFKAGARFWTLRQAQHVRRTGFPPLTPYLGDDGKIYFKGE